MAVWAVGMEAVWVGDMEAAWAVDIEAVNMAAIGRNTKIRTTQYPPCFD